MRLLGCFNFHNNMTSASNLGNAVGPAGRPRLLSTSHAKWRPSEPFDTLPRRPQDLPFAEPVDEPALPEAAAMHFEGGEEAALARLQYYLPLSFYILD